LGKRYAEEEILIINIKDSLLCLQGDVDMGKKIIQINVKCENPKVDFAEAYLPAAQSIADVKGLLWKVWLMNEEEKTAGGIYLFEDGASVKEFLGGPIVAAVMSNPALSDIEAKVFGVISENSKITRGPID
jgi:hypothetical protein